MNIGIVTTWFERGAAYVSKAYADALSKKHNVFIYARGGEKYAVDDIKWNKANVTWGYRYARLGTRIKWSDFKFWLIKNKIDTILFNEQNDWEVIVNCRELGVNIVSYIDYYKQDTVELFDLYDAVICNTMRHFEVFRAHNNCKYIPWGTNTDVFKPMKRNNDCLTFFHSAGMGGVNFRKGTDVVVNCFTKLKGNVRLIIHSQVPLDKFAHVAELIKNDNRIEYINQEVSAPGLYFMGDVYLYPSKLEGIGLTIAEALSCGLPVITTNNPPMNEFVVHNLNGKLVDVKRFVSRSDAYYWPESECCEQSFYNAMLEISDEYNKNKLLDIKANTRDYALANLDWTKNANELCSLFENISPDVNKNINLLKYKYTALIKSYSDRKCWFDDVIYYSRRVGRFINGLDLR